MKNKELRALKSGLDNVSDLSGVKFSYLVSYNSRLINAQIEHLDVAIKPREEYQKFLTEKQELLTKYADKDEKGNPKTEQRQQGVEYVISEDNMKKYERAFKKLKIEHQEAIDAREKQEAEYNVLIEEEFEDSSRLKKITLDDLPENITFGQLFSIFKLVESDVTTKSVTMTNEDIRAFSTAILQYFNNTGLDFIYPIINNYFALADIIDEISEQITWSQPYQEYNMRRTELARSHARLDENGNPMTQQVGGGTSFVIEDVDKFNSEIEKLKSKYTEAIKAKEEQDVKTVEFLKQEREISLSLLTFDDLIESITPNQLKSISFMINDDE